MDVRVHRLTVPAKMTEAPHHDGYRFFELDMISVIEKKKQVMQEASPNREIFYIGISSSSFFFFFCFRCLFTLKI
jgi:hypothetical protein